MDRLTNKFGEVTAGFSGAQKTTMAAIFVALIAGVWMFSTWASTTEMAPLYSDLETSDAASVTVLKNISSRSRSARSVSFRIHHPTAR